MDVWWIWDENYMDFGWLLDEHYMMCGWILEGFGGNNYYYLSYTKLRTKLLDTINYYLKTAVNSLSNE